MLVAAPYISPERVWVNALFLQPTHWCAKNCKGCYVKGFEQNEGVEETRTVWIDLMKALNRNDPHPLLLANQITMAFDTLPTDKQQQYEMKMIGNEFLRMRTDRPGEYHATANSVEDFLDYFNSSWKSCITGNLQRVSLNNEKKDMHLLDVLSFSNIQLNDISTFPGFRTWVTPHINWNLTIFPGTNLDKIKAHFMKVQPHVDSIYLVLHKPATGKNLDSSSWAAHLDMRLWVKTLPEEIRKKVNTDGCAHDTQKFLDTGYGCSSNVSRFQVWPDGSVSGCAYQQKRITPPAKDLQGLLQNFYTASKVYEFDGCKIPNIVDPNSPRVNHNNHLQIID
jgi:hypothetical protein